MKNKVMHCLKDSKLNKIDKYNQLVDFLAQKKSFLQLRMFNQGYSDARMDVLVAETKKAYEIKDLDLHKFNAEDYEKQLQEKEQEVPENTGTETNKEPETELSEQETKFLEALKQNEDATAGLKLREEYPFLREESTPQELKALVTDKITAWYDFAEKHEELAKMVENSGNTISENGEPDPLAVLCKEAIDK